MEKTEIGKKKNLLIILTRKRQMSILLLFSHFQTIENVKKKFQPTWKKVSTASNVLDAPFPLSKFFMTIFKQTGVNFGRNGKSTSYFFEMVWPSLREICSSMVFGAVQITFFPCFVYHGKMWQRRKGTYLSTARKLPNSSSWNYANEPGMILRFPNYGPSHLGVMIA